MGLERWRYVGRRVECPLCSGRFRAFAPDLWDGRRWHGSPNRCPACGSLARHRFLWLCLQQLPLRGDERVLHVAPEAVIAGRLRAAVASYTSTDIEPGRAEVEADLTALPFEDAAFDLVVCSHVLEHVPDDRAAMRELHRVLGPRGAALIQTPVNYDQAETYEDPSATDPDDRLRRFSQADHVRVFGRDLAARLEAVGFDVVVEDAAELGEDTVMRLGLAPTANPLRNDIYRCVRPE